MQRRMHGRVIPHDHTSLEIGDMRHAKQNSMDGRLTMSFETLAGSDEERRKLKKVGVCLPIDHSGRSSLQIPYLPKRRAAGRGTAEYKVATYSGEF